ncbi:MAG TPA: hypothetical protein VMS56_06030 [Thermoanaerobaculia bacterium]|nr:hypothetical protein [Thermoanaerobaculia bacterium]
MSRRVRGVLFAGHVRMIRAAKSIPWEQHLSGGDLEWLSQRIDEEAWYPMDSYERIGLAIFEQIARRDHEMVREWGRRTIDELRESGPGLPIGRDPRETFMRFQLLQWILFDFPAAEVIALREGKAIIEVRYGMSPGAEEAAAWQSLGFLERLMEISGAEGIDVSIEVRAWEGAPATRIAVSWKAEPLEAAP